MLGAFSWAENAAFGRPTGPCLGPVCAYGIFWRTQRPSMDVIWVISPISSSTAAGSGARGPAGRPRRRSGEVLMARAPRYILIRRPPHRPGGRREGASDALFLTGTATARRRATLVVDVAPVNSAETTGISISRLNHSRRAPKGGRTPHGFAAPQPRPWELPGAQSRGSGAFAPQSFWLFNLGTEQGRPRAGGQNGPGLGLQYCAALSKSLIWDFAPKLWSAKPV